MKKNGKNPGEIKSITPAENETGNEGIVDPFLELFEEKKMKRGTSRRDFLKVLGFSFGSAAIMASCKRPVQKALPYVIQPPEVTPGKALYYASSFYDGHEYSAILVKTRDGRHII